MGLDQRLYVAGGLHFIDDPAYPRVRFKHFAERVDSLEYNRDLNRLIIQYVEARQHQYVGRHSYFDGCFVVELDRPLLSYLEAIYVGTPWAMIYAKTHHDILMLLAQGKKVYYQADW